MISRTELIAGTCYARWAGDGAAVVAAADRAGNVAAQSFTVVRDGTGPQGWMSAPGQVLYHDCHSDLLGSEAWPLQDPTRIVDVLKEL